MPIMTLKPKGNPEKVVVSAVRLTSSQDPEHQRTQAKSRWQRLNPLRLQKVPDVPQERMPSREHGASFLSRIFFLWVTPFINVSNRLIALPNAGWRKLIMRYVGRLPARTRARGYLESQPISNSREPNREARHRSAAAFEQWKKQTSS